MTYRKLNIDGEHYEFTVGKKNVHIKGGKLTKPLNFDRITVGMKVERCCECCGTPLSQLGDEPSWTYAVTPKIVHELILKNVG